MTVKFASELASALVNYYGKEYGTLDEKRREIQSKDPQGNTNLSVYSNKKTTLHYTPSDNSTNLFKTMYTGDTNDKEGKINSLCVMYKSKWDGDTISITFTDTNKDGIINSGDTIKVCAYNWKTKENQGRNHKDQEYSMDEAVDLVKKEDTPWGNLMKFFLK